MKFRNICPKCDEPNMYVNFNDLENLEEKMSRLVENKMIECWCGAMFERTLTDTKTKETFSFNWKEGWD